MPDLTELDENISITLEQQERMIHIQQEQNERSFFFDAAKAVQLRVDLSVIKMLQRC